MTCDIYLVDFSVSTPGKLMVRGVRFPAQRAVVAQGGGSCLFEPSDGFPLRESLFVYALIKGFLIFWEPVFHAVFMQRKELA